MFGETNKGPTFEHGDFSAQERGDHLSEVSGEDGPHRHNHRNHDAEIGDDWTLKF